MDVLSSSLLLLNDASQHALASLDNLKARINSVLFLIDLEGEVLGEAKMGRLWQRLWARIGGDYKELQSYQKSLLLLNKYAEFARTHILEHRIRLSNMATSLRRLQEEVAVTPAVVTRDGLGGMSLETQLSYIRSALEEFDKAKETVKGIEDRADRKSVV